MAIQTINTLIQTMTNEEIKYLHMRDFSRVDAQIPLEVRLISAEERMSAKSKISVDTTITYFSSPKEHEDRVLAEWLNMLNDKLDSIIMLLTFHRDGFSTLPYRSVNISGGGMSFTWNCSYSEGDVLEIKMLLPMFPPVAMYLYGEVVTSEAHGPDWLIAVRFINIDEDIRDEIVRFVFKKQREVLREKRK